MSKGEERVQIDDSSGVFQPWPPSRLTRETKYIAHTYGLSFCLSVSFISTHTHTGCLDNKYVARVKKRENRKMKLP